MDQLYWSWKATDSKSEMWIHAWNIPGTFYDGKIYLLLFYSPFFKNCMRKKSNSNGKHKHWMEIVYELFIKASGPSGSVGWLGKFMNDSPFLSLTHSLYILKFIPNPKFIKTLFFSLLLLHKHTLTHTHTHSHDTWKHVLTIHTSLWLLLLLVPV